MLAVRTISRPAPTGATAADTDWRQAAACVEADPELFFPVDDSPSSTGPARAVCHGCPVVADCLATAIASGDDDGVFGGMTPRQRRAYAAAIRQGVAA